MAYLDKNGLSHLWSRLKTMLAGKASTDLSNVADASFKSKAETAGVTTQIVTTTGSGAAYAASVPGITALTVGARFIMVPHTVSTTTQPTLNVNGLGAKGIRQLTSVNFTAVAPGALNAWLSAGKPIEVMYNGSYWVVDMPRPSGAYLYGSVPITGGGTGATTADAALTNLGAQAKLAGTEGQVVGFNANGEAVATTLITYGTNDMTEGVSALETGIIYIVYE